MPFARYLAPGTPIEVLVLEPSVGMGLRVDLSEVDALGHGYGRAEYIVAADHHDFICAGLFRGTSGQRERFIKALRHNGAGRREIGISRQHDVDALVEMLRRITRNEYQGKYYPVPESGEYAPAGYHDSIADYFSLTKGNFQSWAPTHQACRGNAYV